MGEIFSLFLIGIALSMDAFSLSLGMASFIPGKKKAFILALMVGVMHFVMPLIGNFLGSKITSILEVKADFLLGIILVFIAIQMLGQIIKNEEEVIRLSVLGMIVFALGVSIDSFSVGMGLIAVTTKKYLATSIFSLCSFSFTFGGIMIGKWASKLLGIYANVIGIAILFILGIVHLI